MDEHLVHNLLFKDRELSLGWQVTVQKEEACLHEGAVSSQLVDGIASVEQLAFLSVDESNGTNTAGSTRKARIVGEVACLLTDERAIEGFWSKSRLKKRDVELLAILHL